LSKSPSFSPTRQVFWGLGAGDFGILERAVKLDSMFQKSLHLSPPAAAKGGKSRANRSGGVTKTSEFTTSLRSSKNQVVWMLDAGCWIGEGAKFGGAKTSGFLELAKFLSNSPGKNRGQG
jgi:hypothetical protein